MSGAQERSGEEDAAADAAGIAASQEPHGGGELLSGAVNTAAETTGLRGNLAPGVPLPEAELHRSLGLGGGVGVLPSSSHIMTATLGLKSKLAAVVPLPGAESTTLPDAVLRQSHELRGGLDVLSSAAEHTPATTGVKGRGGVGVLYSSCDIMSATNGDKCKMAAGVPLPGAESAPLPDAELRQALELRRGLDVLSSAAEHMAATTSFKARGGVGVLSSSGGIMAATTEFNCKMSAGVALPGAASAPPPDAELRRTLDPRGGMDLLSSASEHMTAPEGFKGMMAAGVRLPNPASTRTLPKHGGEEVRCSPADIMTATGVLKGKKSAGVNPPAAASALFGGGVVMEHTVDGGMPTSGQCAGETPADCVGFVGLHPSMSSQGVAQDPAASTPVPAMKTGLAAQQLLLASGVCAGEGMVDKGPGTAASITTACANNKLLGSSAGKKRKRSISGPDARIAPNEEPAMTKAIRTWESRKHDPIFFPYKGTVFNSFEEAKEFYNLYSWEVGFGIRLSRDRKNDNEYVTKKDICCSCAGHCPNKRGASCRTGCKAMIRLLRTEDHAWYISRCVTTHNHAMSVSCGEKKQWGSHGEIDPLTKDLIKRLRENNVSIGRVCSILRSSLGGQCLPIRKEVVRSVCAKLSQDNIKDDLAKTMRLLEEMKSADGDMDVRFKVDSNGKIMRMLWCTGKNKERYKQFGDAITFDTTYRTNLYNLPFGVFVGVNNHFQSTIFGGVLLTNEKTEDFEWAFKNFIDVMGGKEPQTILTDQCQAMAAAIKTTMRQARHRWCKWHVLRKAKQWIGDTYSKKVGFKKEFHQLVTEEVSPPKFERRWRQLIRKYNLEKNKFLNRIYKQRGMWARPYFMGIFCAGMTSTQRSESANHMLKQFIQRSAPMHLFVSKFNELQFDRIEQEDREVHLTKQVRRRRRVGVPIERHAEEIYTRAMYERFSNELYYSGSYSIRESLGCKEFKVAHYKEPKGAEEKYFTVSYDMMSIVTCTCGLFEHSGMLCRHCLKVLVHLEVAKIPSGNILRRWTKAATDEGSSMGDDGVALNAAVTADYTLKQLLLKRVLAASGVDTRVCESAAKSAINALEKLTSLKPNSGKSDTLVLSNDNGSSDGSVPYACPDRPPRKGRPTNTSLKSFQEGVKKQASKRAWSDPSSGPSTTDEEQPRSGKTRALDELI